MSLNFRLMVGRRGPHASVAMHIAQSLFRLNRIHMMTSINNQVLRDVSLEDELKFQHTASHQPS